MSTGLLIGGIVRMVAAIVSGGMRRLGAELPGLAPFPRRIMPFTLGLVFAFASFGLRGTPAATDVAYPSDESDTCSVQALSCLSRSSAAVAFRSDAAAARNVRDGLSASEARADAETLGASGKAAQLCGVVQSGESSPLGKHLAAVPLVNPRPGDGQASEACMKMAAAFL